MGIGSLSKKKGRRVIGIDASTKSVAYAIFQDGKPVTCGEFFLVGATVFERLKDAKRKTRAMVDKGILIGDYIAIESAINVRNVQVAIDLAYVYGTIIGELMESNPEVHKVAPITWQSAIGNPNLKPSEKAQIRIDNPNMTKSWYSNKGRLIRKQRTIDIINKYFKVADGHDNIGDAAGIALYVDRTLTRKP